MAAEIFSRTAVMLAAWAGLVIASPGFHFGQSSIGFTQLFLNDQIPTDLGPDESYPRGLVFAQ